MGVELLSSADIQTINRTSGHQVIPARAKALRYDGGNVQLLDSNNAVIPADTSGIKREGGDLTFRNAGDEIKRAVVACLGINFFSAVSAWAAVESAVSNWRSVAKFVLRRVGLVAAISCGGGVFAEYLQ